MGVNKKFIFICILAILVFSVSVIANEPIIDFRLTVYNNDSAQEHWFHLSDGIPITYHRRGGTYNLTILDNKGGIVFNQPIEMDLEYEEILSQTLDYTTPYNQSMYEFRLYHWENLVFSKILNFCNKDGVCDTSETYESCPQDCPLDRNDIICIADEDGFCDPDCGEDVDPDCNGKFYPYAGQDKEVEAGGSLEFKGEIKNATGTYTYSWFFEYDGSTETGKKVSRKFDEEGVFAVDLTVTDQEGVYKEDTLLVTVTKKRIVKETKPFFTRIPTLMLLAVALLGIVLFYKKLKEIRIKLRIGIITLISILLVSVILLSFFFIGEEVEYYHENYCEKDSDCEGWGCGGCRSIFKGSKSEVTSQAITGYSVCLSPICVCENNQCEVFNTENVSEEYCKRREDAIKKLKSYCYTDLAKKLNDITFCDSVEEYDINLQCKEELMGKDVTVEFCKLYTQEGWKIACIRAIARRLNNSAICNELDEGPKESCILYDVGDVTSREDCEKMKHYKSNCYLALSKKINDSSLCDKVTDEYWKGECILRYATSKEDCEKIESVNYNFKEQCIVEHATSVEDCEKINYWECYRHLAQRLKNSDICYKIGTVSLIEECTSEIIASLTSVEDCKKIGKSFWSIPPEQQCYVDFAKRLNDSSICNKIEREDLKEGCILDVTYPGDKYIPEECKLIEDKNLQKECVMKSVTSKEECDKMGSLRLDCYHYLALKSKGIRLCYMIEKDELYRNCAIELIKSLTSVEECKKMSVWKDQCYSHLAKKLKDSGICEEVTREEVKELCMIPFITEPEGCKTLSLEYPQSQCYHNFAKKLKEDIEFCDKIRQESLKDSCKEGASQDWPDWVYKVDPDFEFYITPEKFSGYLFESATSIEDCNKIKEEDYREECMSRVKGLLGSVFGSTMSIEDCDKRESLRLDCYYYLALKLKDMSLCCNIEDHSLYFNCAYDLIASLTFVEDCEKMGEWEAQCYTYFAKNLGDANICDKIGGGELKELCMFGLITEPEGCETLKIEYPQSVCYYEFAKKLKKDTNFCDKIKYESFKNDCKEYASRDWKDFEFEKDSGLKFYILPEC